ncbi:NADH dehydrogenase [bioreactor metagenome]|uniref:NADH dehydrogenase n=1 Tax=bioreactor metagenome TaxID=1076179 RepID=A0A645EBZ9_9ZZZZ
MCDGFFYRGKNVAVIGNGEYALHEAGALTEIAASVTILSNGEEKKIDVPENIHFSDKKIRKITGDEKVREIVFEDDSTLSIDGIFVAVGIAGSTALAKKLGVITEGNNIAVDDNMATNIPGLYCAGDCTGGLLQVSKSVYDGAKAGTEMVKFLRNNKK